MPFFRVINNAQIKRAGTPSSCYERPVRSLSGAGIHIVINKRIVHPTQVGLTTSLLFSICTLGIDLIQGMFKLWPFSKKGGKTMFKCKAFLLMIFFFSVLIWTVTAYGSVIEGPVLSAPEGGWRDFGLVIRAEADVVLVSVRFPNQGLADTIELRRQSDGALLASIPTDAGTSDVIVDINYPLTASEIYLLVATTEGNRFWALLDTPTGNQVTALSPYGNEDVTVLSSYASSNGTGYLVQGYWFSFNDITTQPESTQVMQAVIDIKPGSYPNSINLRSKGLVPVAILSTENFDASRVNPDNVQMAGASPIRWVIEDVDSDGNNDMMLHFRTVELTGLSDNSTEAVLTGNTFDGTPFEGSDSVNIVPKHK
jgi:hypothetical protein